MKYLTIRVDNSYFLYYHSIIGIIFNLKIGEAKMSENRGSGGIGFIGLLTIVFIVLKLTHVITWSWFWVLFPIIFSFGLVITVIAILIKMGSK